MEMRRARPRSDSNPRRQSRVTSRGRVERGILTAYWLVSGYGLHAWRAMAGLAVVTALFAAAFHLAGFAVPPRPVSYWTSLLYAFRATLSLTDNQVTLTPWGQLLQGVLRLTGPVLLGPGPARPPRAREALSDSVRNRDCTRRAWQLLKLVPGHRSCRVLMAG
jgi:hypothetical protein